MCNLIIAKLCGNDGLEVTYEQAKQVTRNFRKLNEFEQRKYIYEAAKEISNDSYVGLSTIKLAGHIINAINKNELGKLIYIGELE